MLPGQAGSRFRSIRSGVPDHLVVR
jgi:hypothetical protein